MKNKLNIILYIIAVFLIFTFGLSFIQNKKESRKPLKSALMNPKYKDSLTNFTIYDANNALEFDYNGHFWTINLPTNPENKIPADSQKIENLIKNLTKVRNMYKISDSFDQNNSYGFEILSTIHILYDIKSPEGNLLTDIAFGNHDFSQQYRYCTTSNSSAVYEIESDLDSFLTSKQQLWTEGNIISKSILNSTDVQKIVISDFIENKAKSLTSASEEFSTYVNRLLDLRQGGLPEEDYSSQLKADPIASVRIIFGNLEECNLNIFQTTKEGEYLLQENYKLSDAAATITYTTKISGWTFSKLQ